MGYEIDWQAMAAQQQERIAELEEQVEHYKTDNAVLSVDNDELERDVARLRDALEKRDELLVQIRGAVFNNHVPTIRFDGGNFAIVDAIDVTVTDEALSATQSTGEEFERRVKAEARENEEFDDALLAVQYKILSDTAVALKGQESELTRHSFHDLPEIAANKRLNLARLIDMCDRLFHRVALEDSFNKGTDIIEEMCSIVYSEGKQTPADARAIIHQASELEGKKTK